jgi:hypothetical protein
MKPCPASRLRTRSTLILGALIYSIMIWRWPIDAAGTMR